MLEISLTQELQDVVDEIAEVSGYMWERGWAERTGKMTELTNTVILEGVSCGGETTFGICRRAECLYWREIWLQRDIKPVHI